MQPASIAQLLAHHQKRRCPDQKQTTEHSAPGTGPDPGDRAGHPTEIFLGQGREHLLCKTDQPGESHQNQAANTEQQGHQQARELPATGLIQRQEERLGKVAQLDELAAQPCPRSRG